jgi:membrane-associated protease RseP (regulator of RpoE activity)
MLSIVRASLLSAASALAITLTLAAPASADHWRGHPGMGQPHCQEYHGYHPGMHGHGGCPYMHGDQASPAMGGKTLGVMVSDLPNAMLDEADMPYGINVESVRPDSAAAAAGIRAGDVIAEFAGKPVYSAERLRWLVRKAQPGKGVEIKLMREGKPFVVTATLSEPAPKEKCDAMPAPRQGN